MDKKQDVNEAFIQNETNTELDAIHPRFMPPVDHTAVQEFETRNHYYCDACQLFFAPTVSGLKRHFSGEMVQHTPYASCFYCQGKVFQYKFNEQRQLYHNCKDAKGESS